MIGSSFLALIQNRPYDDDDGDDDNDDDDDDLWCLCVHNFSRI